MPYHRPIPDDKTRSNSSGFQSLVQAEKLMQIAFVLPSATIIGWLAGAWAGNHFHVSWFAIAGVIFGSISGLVFVVRMAMDAEKSTRPDNEIGNGTGKGTSDPEQ